MYNQTRACYSIHIECLVVHSAGSFGRLAGNRTYQCVLRISVLLRVHPTAIQNKASPMDCTKRTHLRFAFVVGINRYFFRIASAHCSTQVKIITSTMILVNKRDLLATNLRAMATSSFLWNLNLWI